MSRSYETKRIRGKSYLLVGYSPYKYSITETKKYAKKRGYDKFVEQSEMKSAGKDFFGKAYKKKKWFMLYARKS